MEYLRTAQGNFLENEVLLNTLDQVGSCPSALEPHPLTHASLVDLLQPHPLSPALFPIPRPRRAQSKVESQELTHSLLGTRQARERFQAFREAYWPAAVNASTLFFAVASLAKIDPMYQFSLARFTALFAATIRDAGFGVAGGDKAGRVAAINKAFTFAVYEDVTRSLFGKDKLLFAFLMTVRVVSASPDDYDTVPVDAAEWRFLATATVSLEATLGGGDDDGGEGTDGNGGDSSDGRRRRNSNPASQLFPDRVWKAFQQLLLLPAFEGLDGTVGAHRRWWERYMALSGGDGDPLAARFPERFADLTTFQRLLAVRVFHPRKLIPSMQAYVSAHLGPEFVAPPSFNLGMRCCCCCVCAWAIVVGGCC